MTVEFCEAFHDLLLSVLTGYEAYNQQTGQPGPVNVYECTYPPPQPGYTEGEAWPYVRWAIYAGEFRNTAASKFSIAIEAGIYTPGSQSDGNREILQLLHRLSAIAHIQPVEGYRIGEVTFAVGAQDPFREGAQNHPYYCARILCDCIYSGHRARCTTSK